MCMNILQRNKVEKVRVECFEKRIGGGPRKVVLSTMFDKQEQKDGIFGFETR